MSQGAATPQVGDVVRIGKGNTLWTVCRHDRSDYGDCTVHLWDLLSQSTGLVKRLGLRSDQPRLTLVWTLEEVIFGADLVSPS